MKILTICGSNREASTNLKLVNALPFLFPKQYIYNYKGIYKLPLFEADLDSNPLPPQVVEWRKLISEYDAIIICTPEYIHNIPAVLKNALEWITSSGELDGKLVLPITFTPHPPRGEKAMQSLLFSLLALNARVVTQLHLFQSDIIFNKKENLDISEGRTFLEEAIQLLIK